MNESNMLPGYKEIFTEIGKQLSLRKTTMIKRIFLITWPILLFIIANYFINAVYDFDTFTPEQFSVYLKFVLPYLVLSIIYTIVIRFIFRIEKQIWIDSFFDKKDLKPSESWKISMKLFWPVFSFRARIWLQFYLFPLVIAIALFVLIIQFILPIFIGYDMTIYSTLTLSVVFIVSLVVYGYYLKTKLRYTYFIFLDSFGKNVSFGSMIDEMNKLNDVSKSESFKKSLLINIGADSVNSIAISVTGLIGNGIAQFGGAGKLVGNLVRAYGEEASRQVTELGNISAQYILYRFARKEAYGTEQEVNEDIYRLSESLKD